MIITAIFYYIQSHKLTKKTPSAHLNNYYSVKKADNRKDYRLYIADRGESVKDGPGNHGRTIDHNNRRCSEPDRILQSGMYVPRYGSLMKAYIWRDATKPAEI